MLILTHDHPDPDAIAAAYGLAYLARERFGIESRICYGGVIGRVENRAMVRLLRIPMHLLRRSELRRHKSVALVDTQPHFQNNSFPSDRRATIVIDQHPSGVDPAADLALVDTEAGATCAIVAEAILAVGLPIPVRLATALAYGIITDTLDLYRARRSDVVQTYLTVLQSCDMKTLARIRNPVRSKGFFVTLGRGLREARLVRRLIFTHLGPVPNPDLVAEMAELLLTYKAVGWALVTGRYKGKLFLSLRTTKPNAGAGELLRSIVPSRTDAGGHQSIAGGSFVVGIDATPERWQQEEQELLDRLFRRLRIPRRVEVRRAFES